MTPPMTLSEMGQGVSDVSVDFHLFVDVCNKHSHERDRLFLDALLFDACICGRET